MNFRMDFLTMWELTVGAGGGLGGGGQRGENWDNCNRVTIKNKKHMTKMNDLKISNLLCSLSQKSIVFH